MECWRLSRFPDLAGLGGLRTGARWHTAGHPVVYLARSVPGAILEVIVHLLEGDAPPSGYRLLRIEIPNDVGAQSIPAAQLPPNWQDDMAVTRSLGDQWLTEQKAALLHVPSAIAPATENVILNPLHPDAASIRIAEVIPFEWDRRLGAVLMGNAPEARPEARHQ